MGMMTAPKLILRYEGEFAFQGLYDLMAAFFRKRNYDFLEKIWKEKDATPAGREITIRLIPEKFVTEYVKFSYTIEWKTSDAHKVSENAMFGRFHLHVIPEYTYDWQGFGADKSWIGKLFQKHVFKKEQDDVYLAELGMEAQTLLDEINAFLGSEIS